MLVLSLGGGGQIFSPFQIILNKFDFFHLWQKKCVRPQIYFFWGGGLKSPKLIFNEFSSHFKQFWTTLIFSFSTTIFCTPTNFYFFGGGPKKSKTRFRLIFSPFQAILNNFDFLNFWEKFFVRPRNLIFFLGGGYPKINFVHF